MTPREIAHKFCHSFECDSGTRHSKNCDWLTGMIAEALAQEREACARVAETYVINEGELHPDVPFAAVSQTAKGVAHATCQYVAAAIRSHTDKP